MDFNSNKKATDAPVAPLKLPDAEAIISDDDFTINECGDTQWTEVLAQEERRLEALKIQNERQ